jgi:hypothetical protein
LKGAIDQINQVVELERTYFMLTIEMVRVSGILPFQSGRPILMD